MGLNSAFLSQETLSTLGFASLGDDVLVHSSVVIVDCAKISLGSRVRIDPFTVISTRGGVTFGDNVHIGSHAVIAGHAAVQFGSFVNISHHVGIYTSNEDLSGRSLSHPTVSEACVTARTASVVFERHSGVGAGSVVLPGARFGEGSILGALSRTSRPLKPWTTYVGVPARKLRDRRRDVLTHELQYLAAIGR
jgi:galactoside O-acetyltransferase